jgi:hypothetical protein
VEDGVLQLWMVGVGAVVLVFCAALVKFKMSSEHEEKVGELQVAQEKYDAITAKLKVLLTFVQILGSNEMVFPAVSEISNRREALRMDGTFFAVLPSQSLSPPLSLPLSLSPSLSLLPSLLQIPWPASMVSLYQGLSAFNLDLSKLFFKNAELCGLQLVGFVDKFRMQMGLVPLFFFVLVLAFGVAKTWRWPGGDVEKLTTNFVILVLLIYPGVCTKVFQSFACVPVSLSDSFLKEDLRIKCEGGTHNALVAQAVVFMLIYVAGIPLVILVMLRWFRYEN